MSRVSVIQNFINFACQIFTYGNEQIVRLLGKSPFKVLPYIIYIGIVFVLSSCVGRGGSNTETPTSGNIKILVDESFKPLLETEVNTFTALYPYAHITPEYKPEVDVVNEFMHDSARVMVTSRKLTDDQIKYLRDTLIIARTTTFAYDAVALVINKENPDSLLKYDEVKNIFTGKITEWKEINRNSRLGAIKFIFDNTKSGNIRYFREKFEYNDPFGDNFYAMNSNSEVINYVERNKDALGIVSSNWISDLDDSSSYRLINKIKVVALTQPYLDQNTYYKPDQGFIVTKDYPFIREVYLISRETFSGLGSGFIQWACAEQGQRIVRLSGLVPATMPIRLVRIKQE